jgi:signal transduction histidine kinase
VAVLTTGLLMWGYAFLAYFTMSSKIPGIVGFICAAIHLLSPLLFRISANAFMISNIMIGSGMIHQATFSFYTGGFESDILIWYGILPVLAGVIAGRRAAVFWSVVVSSWAAVYLIMHLNGFIFPNVISPTGKLTAHAFMVFGWIFLGTCMIYVVLLMNENQEKKLAEQSQKIDDLFRVLFHDLAGPLSRISIGLNISKNEATPENKQHGMEIAIKATDVMLEITQNVRKMYAVSKGRLSSELSYYALTEAVDYVSRLYAAELERKHIHLDFDVRKYRGLMVQVEPVSFKNQVLGNAISNAIKFSPPESRILIRSYPVKDYHVVEVVDQGMGIPKALQDHLFDITKKTSRPGTLGESGNGFGMHIMKSFMEMYKGKIEIVSFEEVPGTMIRLYLKAQWNQGGSPLPENN